MRRPKLLAAGLLAWSSQVHAASDLPPEVGFNYGQIEVPRTLALGGADHATANGAGSLFVNPANTALTPIYHVGGFAEIWPEAERYSYGAAAVDSISNSRGLAGAIGARTTRQDSDGIDRRFNEVRFALALPFEQRFFVGAGGRLLWLSQNGRGPLGPAAASAGLSGERIVNGFTFDAGATFKPHRDFSIAAVGTNLTSPDHGFQPLSLGGGLAYAPSQFTLEADVVADFKTWERTSYRVMTGGELLVGEGIFLRAGYRYDDGLGAHAVSGGLGYGQPTFSATAAVRRYLGDEAATAVVLGITVHLEATGLTATPSQTF